MAQRSHKIIVVLLGCCWPFILAAQKTGQHPAIRQQIGGRLNDEQHLSVQRYYSSFIPNNLISGQALSSYIPQQIIFSGCYGTLIKGGCYPFSLPPWHYTESLGFFCRKELQIQKIITMPLRFRLGSTDYVNWMEQKPNAIKPR